jgi:hypothetical protein
MIDLEIIRALGISLSFFGVIISIVAVGISFLRSRVVKEKSKEFLKMALLIVLWAIFILFSVFFCKTCVNIYNPIFLEYSLIHLITTLIGVGTVIIYLFMFKDLSKTFDKKMLISAGIVAMISILQRSIIVFFNNPYPMLINRITIIIPTIIGFFMIIKASTKGKEYPIMKMIKSSYIILAGLILILLFSFNNASINLTGNVISEGITGNVISEEELKGLELSIEVPEKYQNVRAGEMLQFKVELKNIQKAGRHDIQLDYYIKKNEITLAHRRELKAIETQASFLSSIKVPEETLPGLYNIEVQINEERSSIGTFYVKSSEVGQIRTYLIILIIVIVVVGGMISWQLHRLTKGKRR